MKTIIALSLSALLLASCAMQSGENSGSLTLKAPRAALTNASGTAYTMRYSLRKAGEIILLDNRKYAEVTGSDTITVDNLLPGDGYTLSLSIGDKSGNNLAVKYYGTTAAFTIASGTTTDVSLTLATAPAYTFLTSSGALASVANVNGTKWVLDGTALKSFTTDPGTAATATAISLDTAAYGTVNSLSTGKYFSGTATGDELWINTSKGMYRGTAGDHSLNNGIAIGTLFSKAAYVSGKIIAMYSGGAALVGMKVASSQTDLAGAWQTINDSSDLKEYTADITKDVISGIGVNNDISVYYVSTAVGTVIGNSTITSMDDLLAIKNDQNNPRWLKAGSDNIPINVVASAGTGVFAGTNSGVYSSTVDSATGIPPLVSGSRNLALISGTAGLKIVAIDSVKRSDGAVLTAAVTDKNDVLLFKDAALVQTLDAAIGVPESAAPLFYIESSAVHLTLAGTNGAIDYQPAIN